jgi:hypothetical protein
MKNKHHNTFKLGFIIHDFSVFIPKTIQAYLFCQETGPYYTEKLLKFKLDFGYSEGTFRAYFNTGLATEAFIGVYSFRFAIYHFVNLRGASVYTFLVAGALVFVNIDLPHN